MDTISKERRSWVMSRVRGKDTKPEMVVRRLVHSMGFRYRLHRRDLPGKPDLAFIRIKKAIFVHGCFWHSHSDEKCTAASIPASNARYWEHKLERNRQRDKRAVEALEEDGWSVLTIWECSLKDIDGTSTILKAFLTGQGSRINDR